MRRALEREDLFTVVADVFPTDTVDLADVVLPAASWLEFDDLVVPYFHRALAAQVKAVDPPGEALPNSEIFRRVAAALGLEQSRIVDGAVTVPRLVTVTPADGRGLRRLAEAAGRHFQRGIVLYGGTSALPTGDPRMLAVPLAELWSR